MPQYMHSTEILRIHHDSSGTGTEPQDDPFIVMPETVKHQRTVTLTVKASLPQENGLPGC